MSGILDQSSNRARFWLAGAAAGLIVAGAVTILPQGGTALPAVAPFMPIYLTAVIIMEGLTAYLLGIQFRANRTAYLGGLAGAYGYVTVLAVLQLLVFPGLFTASGLLGAGPQSAVWIWVLWHAGFPTFVTLALLTRTARAAAWLGPHLSAAGLALLAAGPLAALCLAALAVAGGGLLPPLIAHNSYQMLNQSPAAKIVVAALVLALAACVRITRLGDLLSLWVAIALLASLADSALVLTATARYSLGWYAGRLLNVVSSSVVFCVLIYEFLQLYERLVRSNFDLAERALRDGLTRAFNRGFFAEQFPRELRRAVREGAPMSVLMIDVDHFKNYNDTSGHQMGDQCLIDIVGALQSAIRRPGDFVARYGGEEFVAVLPRTGAEGALSQAEAMRRAVANLAIPRRHGGVVTISLGIATIDPAVESVTAEELLQRADIALYDAKRAGRDRIHLYEFQKELIV